MRKGKWRQGLLCGTLAAMMSLGACAKEDAGTSGSTNAEAVVTTEANVTNEGATMTESFHTTQGLILYMPQGGAIPAPQI